MRSREHDGGWWVRGEHDGTECEVEGVCVEVWWEGWRSVGRNWVSGVEEETEMTARMGIDDSVASRRGMDERASASFR